MAYPVEKKISNSNGWFTPAQAKAYYGRYSRDGVTVHWWGDGTGANNHDNIVNYFLRQSRLGAKSVNYVVSDRKITKMVEPDNVAWASQSGNPTTVSIEFQPTLSSEGYKRGGWLIAQLEKKYGKKLKLYKHSHWFATACPGSINVNLLRKEADKAKKGNDMYKGRDAKTWYSYKEIWKKKALTADKSLEVLKKKIAELSKRPTKEQLDAVNKQLDKAQSALSDKDDTNEKVNTIFNYFAERWQTFRDFLKK